MLAINNQRIVKNTMMLYLRMILVMAVTLFTTRIVLKNLGVEDYGIYNVVGGIVAMFAFLNSAMAGATQRFLSFELGINDKRRVNMVFSISVIIHLLIATIILVLAETIGLWFVYNKLTIPIERFSAAMWVYQFSIMSFILNVINVPYNAAIIAHERMNIYAWVSIIDVILRLCIAYSISVAPFDRLILYSVLIFIQAFIIFIVYRTYSKRHFSECNFSFVLDKKKFLEMFSFAGWNIIGSMAYALRGQGSNILLNMFFGPAVNAARAVAHQVDGAVEQFVTNFQTASNPQIVKSYAQEEYKQTMKLVCQCSKFSFYLMVLIGFPIYFQIKYILSVWLTDIPVYTSVFVQLILLNGIIDSVSKAIKTYIKATGHIKWYMIIQGGFYLLALPTIYLFLKMGYSPVSSIVVLCIFTFLGTFLRLVLVRVVAKGFSIRYFFRSVIIPVVLVGVSSYGSSLIFTNHFSTQSLITFVSNTAILFILISSLIWWLGITVSERTYIVSTIKNYIDKIWIKKI